MRKYVPASTLTNSQALRRLATLTNAVRDAQCDLDDLLLELHDDPERWETMTYATMASAMGLTRQAVQQRVMRLLESDRRRRVAPGLSDPNQLLIDL